MLLHNILPHEHHSELADAQHEESHLAADSLLDYLKLVFHVDMGEGHLDHIDSCQSPDWEIVSQDVDLPFKVSFIQDLSSSTPLPNDSSKEQYLEDDPLQERQVSNSLSLRGPPFIS